MSMADVEEPATCAACGHQLPVQQGRGRIRRYCNATCRSAARRQRQPARGRISADVKQKLTTNRRHVNLDIARDETWPVDPVASRIQDTAGRVIAELARPGAGSPLAAMAAARELAAATNAALQEAADRARAAGHSWREIGDVLDTTRQAAFQRFGRPVDPRTGRPMTRALPPGRTDQAVALFTDIVEGRWEAACRDFTETMREHVDAERIAAVYAQVVGAIGSYERMGEPAAFQLDAITSVEIPLHFEAGERQGQVSFDHDGKVVGLFIRPPVP
jgi:Protein of unknown function (DUF3887)